MRFAAGARLAGRSECLQGVVGKVGSMFRWRTAAAAGAALVALGLAFLPSAAQDGGKGRRALLVLGGASRSMVDAPDGGIEDREAWYTPRLGLAFDLARVHGLVFEVGPMFESRGGDWKDDWPGQRIAAAQAASDTLEYEHSLRLLYLSLPALVRVTLPASPVSPYLKAGLAPGFLLTGREETRRAASGRVHYGYHNIASELERWHLDALAGAGLRFRVAGRPAFIEALYSHGLTDVSAGEDACDCGQGRPKLRNQAVQLLVGFGWRRQPAEGDR